MLDAAPPSALLLSLVPSLALRLKPSAAVRVVAAGLPLFSRMPHTTSTFWPVSSAPWRVCQEGAALVSEACTRRVLRLTSRAAANTLLRRRRTPSADLRQLTADGALEGLETCGDIAGAAVLVLPAHLYRSAAAAAAASPPLALAALLEADGALTLLASDDLIERYADLLVGPVG